MNDLTHSTPARHEQRYHASKRSVLVSAWVNILLALIQIGAGLFAKSQGLVADGIHSLSDLISDFIVLLAGKQSQKEPDAGHQYGHQRFETAASLLLGIILFAVGAGMIMSAIGKFQHIHTIPVVHSSALWVALVALCSKELLFRYQLNTAKKTKSSMLIANAWHARSDAAASLVVSLGIIGNMAGYPIMDPIAAMIVGIVICKMGILFIWSSMHDLLDGAAETEEIEAIRQTLRHTKGVMGIHDLRTRKMGDMIMVDVHLEVDGQINVSEGHDIAERARDNVIQHHPVLDVMTHIDPIPDMKRTR